MSHDKPHPNPIPRPTQEPSEWLAFLDETGDHSLVAIDPAYPLFGLAIIVCRREAYLADIGPALQRLKHRFFGHEGVILRSYDIRKRMNEFRILHDPPTRAAFVGELNSVVASAAFDLFFIAIRKQRHLAAYGRGAASPYELALEFALERLCYFCRGEGVHSLPIVAEARGKNEDDALRLEFFRRLAEGTGYLPSESLARCGFELLFASKRRNVAGLQLADLCAYPLGRHLVSGYAGQDYEIVGAKVYSRGGKEYGLKVFPGETK